MTVAGNIVVEMELDNNRLVVGVKQAGAVLRQFNGTLKSTGESFQKVQIHTTSLSDKFRHLVMTLGNLRFVVMDINDVFLRLPLAILKTSGELERTQTLLGGLSKELTKAGRAAEGAANFEYITKMAKNAPFAISELSDAFVKFKSAGLDPTNGSMQALTDSVARFGGNGESLKRASVAIQQMAGKGVVSMEELRQQLGEAVPTAMKDMADGMGVTMAELGKIVQTGTLEAGPALSKMFVQMRINNEGAAAEMMNTWVGTLSRLQTEWQLTTKLIAESGFGDGAKKAANDIADGLRSDQFISFAKDSGAALGEVVKTAGEIVKTLIKYREEIILAGQAWLAYKVIFSGIVPISRAAQLAYETQTASIRNGTAMAKANAAAKVQAAIDEVAANKAILLQKEADLAKTLAAHKTELASVRARNAQIVAEDAKTRATLAGLERRGFIPGLNDTAARTAAAAQLKDLAAQNTILNARQRELSTSIAVTGASLVTTSAAAAQQTAQLRSLTHSAETSRVATLALGAAKSVLGGAMTLLGGPLGILITTIMGLTYWYNKAGAAAEEAGERMKRANAGAASAKDLSALQQEVNSAKLALEFAKAEAGRIAAVGSKGGVKTSEERARDIAEVKVKQKAYDDALKLAAKATASVEEINGRERVESMNLRAARISQTLTEAAQLEIATIQAGGKARLGALKKDSAEWVKENNKIIKEQQAALVKGIQERINFEAKVENAARAGALKGGTNVSADLKLANDAKVRREQLERELSEINSSIAAKAPYKQKGAGGGAAAAQSTPIQNLIERLSGERAQLNAELAGFDEIKGKADKVNGIIAEFWDNLNTGKLNDSKGKKPSNADFTKALQAAIDVENTKQVLDEKTRSIQKAAKDTEAVATYIEGMRPEVEAAMSLLADPLGSAQRGASQKSVEKWIQKNQDQLKAYAESQKKTVKEIQDSLIGDALRIDDSKRFSELEQETRTLNASLVEDTRQAARAKMQADNEAFRSQMQNIINLRAASNAYTAEEIANMQKQLDSNTQARAADVAAKSQGPMDKLVNQWQNATRNMEEASTGWANSTINAMTDLVVKGKADFKSLAVSIIADIVRIQLQQLAAKAVKGTFNMVASMFGFADGGIMSSVGSVPLKKYAAGGIAKSPQLALFGEGRMNEAYVPLPDGRTIPVTMKGGGGGASGDVMINITVNKDGSESGDSSGDNAGSYKRMADRLKMVVREELATQARPGGLLYK
jgi:tape measure domain-containing protein